MRVAILKCDEVLEKFQPQFGFYYDMIRHMFETVDIAFQFDTFDCRQSHYPDDINSYDFFTSLLAAKPVSMKMNPGLISSSHL